MKTIDIIFLAEQYAPLASMRSSAELCITDAKQLYAAGHVEPARTRAIHSLRYSIGILHPNYAQATAPRTKAEAKEDALHEVNAQWAAQEQP